MYHLDVNLIRHKKLLLSFLNMKGVYRSEKGKNANQTLEQNLK